ncbi:MAG: hypothetical protein ACLP19_26510 [Xanthobacteraceae bacterium]
MRLAGLAARYFRFDASLIRADAGKKKRLPGDQPIPWPRAEEASRAVREYLAALDAAHHDEETGADDGGSGSGNRGKPPKQVSLTDPQAAWVARKNTDPFFAYDAARSAVYGRRARCPSKRCWSDRLMAWQQK